MTANPKIITFFNHSKNDQVNKQPPTFLYREHFILWLFYRIKNVAIAGEKWETPYSLIFAILLIQPTIFSP